MCNHLKVVLENFVEAVFIAFVNIFGLSEIEFPSAPISIGLTGFGIASVAEL